MEDIDVEPDLPIGRQTVRNEYTRKMTFENHEYTVTWLKVFICQSFTGLVPKKPMILAYFGSVVRGLYTILVKGNLFLEISDYDPFSPSCFYRSVKIEAHASDEYT